MVQACSALPLPAAVPAGLYRPLGVTGELLLLLGTLSSWSPSSSSFLSPPLHGRGEEGSESWIHVSQSVGRERNLPCVGKSQPGLTLFLAHVVAIPALASSLADALRWSRWPVSLHLFLARPDCGKAKGRPDRLPTPAAKMHIHAAIIIRECST